MVAVKAMKVVLNLFEVRPLSQEELSPLAFRVTWEPVPSREENLYRLLGRVARRLGDATTHWGAGLVSWKRLDVEALEMEVLGQDGPYRCRLQPTGPVRLNPEVPQDRQALSRLVQKLLEKGLREAYADSKGRYHVEGNLLLGKEWASGKAWSIRRGARVAARVNAEGQILLEVDIVHRISSALTLEAWLNAYPPPRRVRNAYPDADGRYRTWTLVAVEEGRGPEDIRFNGINLLEYHQSKGRIQPGQEVGRLVRLRGPNGDEVYHLAGLLHPVLTLEDLAEMDPKAMPGLHIQPDVRLEGILKVATSVAQMVFGIKGSPRPLETEGHFLPQPRILAGRRGRQIGKPVDVLRTGALKATDSRVGLLVLEGEAAWPQELRDALLSVARVSGVRLELEEALSIRREEIRGLALAAKLEHLAQKGVQALLVSTPPLSWDERNALKRACAQRGIPSQFFNPPLENHKRDVVVMGLLSKLGWRLLRLAGDYPAELTIAFDAGVNEERSIRFGGAACAVTADGGLLAWMLPEAQRGERMRGETVWGMVREALIRFQREYERLPRHVLLVRDGKTQRDEFTFTLEELSRESIRYDLVSVRKSGGGRIYPTPGNRLKDGLYVTLPPEEGKDTFLILTAYPGPRTPGTPRPLKVVHEEGSTALPELARQLFHLTRFYPPSGYRFPSLPAPLHLADRLVREVGRLGVSVLHGLDREKLFFV